MKAMDLALGLLLALATFAPKDADAWSAPRRKTVYYMKPPETTRIWRPGGDWWPPNLNLPISVGAHFDMNGIQGTVHFYQRREGAPVHITVRLDGLNQFQGERWGWHIHEHPINWGNLERNPCSFENIGDHYDPDNRANVPNYMTVCANDNSLCEVGDLNGRHGRLRSNQSVYTFVDNHLSLYGPYSPIGRSILIHRTHGFRYACANIEYDGHQALETFRATFPCNPKEQSPVFQGEVIMRRSAHRHGVTLEANLYRVDNDPSLNRTYNWSLYAGDRSADGCDSCSGLTHVFGTRTHSPSFPNCGSTSIARQNLCPFGSFTGKCGPLESDENGVIQVFCTDTQLGTHPHDTTFSGLSLVIEDENGDRLACSRFNLTQPRRAVVQFRNGSIWVHVVIYQNDPHDPTYLRFHSGGFNGRASGFQIRWNAVPSSGECVGLGPVYEPRFNFVNSPVSPLINQTGDRNFLGELRNKLPSLSGLSSFYQSQRNSYIPLFGDYSVLGRSFVLLDTSDRILGCGNITDTTFYRPIRRSFESYH